MSKGKSSSAKSPSNLTTVVCSALGLLRTVKILDKLKWYWKPKVGFSWRVDETYIKVKGKWVYLYRALGNTVDFYLSRTRNTNATKLFLGKTLKSIPEYYHPQSINTDKNPVYGNHCRTKNDREMPSTARTSTSQIFK